jgi:hypothetical protein
MSIMARVFGFLLGAAGAGLAAYWLLKPGVAQAAGSPRAPRPQPAPMPVPGSVLDKLQHRWPAPTRSFDPLVERWRGEVSKRAGVLPVDPILQWIQIESGGKMNATGNAREIGIWQLYFPAGEIGDAKYGATFDQLHAIGQKDVARQFPMDLSWMTPTELDLEVGSGMRKIIASRDEARAAIRQAGITWSESSLDFGALVKLIHAAPAIMRELLPKIVHASGAPMSWMDFHDAVMAFPVSQMGAGLQYLVHLPSEHKLKNRLEDTMHNAEVFGVTWASAMKAGFPSA